MKAIEHYVLRMSTVFLYLTHISKSTTVTLRSCLNVNTSAHADELFTLKYQLTSIVCIIEHLVYFQLEEGIGKIFEQKVLVVLSSFPFSNMI